MIKHPRRNKWLYIIFGRCFAALLVISALDSIPTVFTAASAEEMVGNVLGLLIMAYLAYVIWVRLGRIYLTIPYRKEIVEKATGLRLELGPLQARGYYIEKTLSQIEQTEQTIEKRNKDREEGEALWNNAVDKLISLHPNVSDEACESLRQNVICLGMPKPFVDFILGDSYEEKRQASTKHERLTCKYVKGRKKNRLGNPTYEWEVKFLDGIVNSFKDL